MKDISLPWLPPTVLFCNFGSDWNAYIEHIYKIFERDFVLSKPKFNNKDVLYGGGHRDGKSECFWHIITENYDPNNKQNSNRDWDLLRCERITWIKPIIENSDDKAILKWKNRRGRSRNILLFLGPYDFLVILNIKKTYFLLTAYYVRTHTKIKLLKEYEEYNKKTASN